MSWETRQYGRYYTRTRRANGCVIREYCGCGEVAERAAAIDRERRREREMRATRFREKQEELAGVDAEVAEACRVAELVAHAALLSAGYYEHRGQWRKRRAKSQID